MKTICIKNSISHMKIRHMLEYVYFIVLMVGLSFFFTEGYWNLGDDKYHIFIYLSYVFIPIWMIASIIDVIHGKNKIYQKIIEWETRDYFILAFWSAAVISTLTSNYRHTSWKGSEGWYMGLFVQSIIVIIYIMAKDLTASISKKALIDLVKIMMGIAGIVFLLGILNRFSIFPIKMKGQQEDFISTLGNINWYSGYWTIWVGIATGLYINAKEKKDRKYLAAYVFLLAIAGVTCGASSCYLVWGGVSVVSLLIILDDPEKILRWIHIQLIALTSLPTVRFIGLIRPNRMWYDSSWLRNVTYGNAWFKPFILGSLALILLGTYIKYHFKSYEFLKGFIIGALVAFVMGIIVIIVLNTIIEGGIWPVRGKRIFTWGNTWGNGRGGIWSVVIRMIAHFPPFTIFFGVGCDCLSEYAYSTTELKSWMWLALGDGLLTNAHNEMLTMLFNEGIYGLIVYIGLIWTHARDGIKNIKNNVFILAMGLAMAGYVSIGLVSFMNILSTPFFFLVMGMLSGLIKRDSVNIMNDMS